MEKIEIDIQAERQRVTAEVQTLQQQLQEIDGQRQEVIDRIVMLKGVLSYLNSKDEQK